MRTRSMLDMKVGKWNYTHGRGKMDMNVLDVGVRKQNDALAEKRKWTRTGSLLDTGITKRNCALPVR